MTIIQKKSITDDAKLALQRSGFTEVDQVFTKDTGDFRAEIKIVAGRWVRLSLLHKQTYIIREVSGDAANQKHYMSSYGSSFFGDVETCIVQSDKFVQVMNRQDKRLAMPVIGKIQNGRTPMDAIFQYNTESERYQAKRVAYARMINSDIHSLPDDLNQVTVPFLAKMIHSRFRYLSMINLDWDKDTADLFMSEYFSAQSLCAFLTPREFMEVFPPTKYYKGKRYGVKDYYWIMEMASNLGMDKPLGENVTKFLYDYDNPIVNKVVVSGMSAMSAIRRSQGKKDMFEVFRDISSFEEDVTTEIVRDKLKAGIDGFEWLVLNTYPSDEAKRQLEEAYVEHDGISGFLAAAKRSVQKEEKKIHDMRNIRDLLTHAVLMRGRNYTGYLQMLEELFKG